jgi:hypothetical protein
LPVESSIESPATPVSQARRTFSATPAASAPKPLSKSAFTGRSVAATISCRCASAMSREMPPSRLPCDQAKPELVVASALNPRLCRKRALPTSQGFGMTKHPDLCSSWKARRLAAMMGRVSAMGGLQGDVDERQYRARRQPTSS